MAAGLLRKDRNLKFFLVQQLHQIKQSLVRSAADQLIVDKNNFNLFHSDTPHSITVCIFYPIR